MTEIYTEQIIPNVSIEAMLARRARAAVLADTIEAALDELRMLASQDFGIEVPRVEIHDYRVQERYNAKTMKSLIDAGMWQWLLKKSGLRTFMDARARKEWEDQLHARAFPELTAENVETAFREVHSNRGDMVSRGVDDLFQRLNRRNFKTNKPTGFGKRIIMGYVLSVWGTGKDRFRSPISSTMNELDDLNRVLHVLRGLPEPEYQTVNAHSIVSNAIGQKHPVATRVGHAVPAGRRAESSARGFSRRPFAYGLLSASRSDPAGLDDRR